MNALGIFVIGAGLGVIGACALWIHGKDSQAPYTTLLPAQDWERELGLIVTDYSEWRREGIAIDEAISMAEFQRLAAASGCRKRKSNVIGRNERQKLFDELHALRSENNCLETLLAEREEEIKQLKSSVASGARGNPATG